MSRLSDLRDAAIARIRADVAAFKDVRAHVGRYTVADLKRLLAASPSCAVGVAGASKPRRRASGEVELDIAFAAVIVTRAARREDADDQAIDLGVTTVASLAAWVPAAAVARVQPAHNIALDAVGDDELDGAGMIVWAVTWSHAVALGVDLAATAIDPSRPLAGDQTLEIDHPARGVETAGGEP